MKIFFAVLTCILFLAFIGEKNRETRKDMGVVLVLSMALTLLASVI